MLRTTLVFITFDGDCSLMIFIRFGIRNISELGNGIFRMTDSQLDNSIMVNGIKVLSVTSKFNLMGVLTFKVFHKSLKSR